MGREVSRGPPGGPGEAGWLYWRAGRGREDLLQVLEGREGYAK